MPKHLILPKDAFQDLRSLLLLSREQLEELVGLFASAESVTATRQDFTDQVAERLNLDFETAQNVVFSCTFLLSVVEDGRPADEVLADVKVFIEQQADPSDKRFATAFDAHRSLFLTLLTPTTERRRAQKICALEGIHPRATAFRTICDLRPVFEERDGREEITGLIPVVSLVVELGDSEYDTDRVILHLSPEMLKDLRDVVERADLKMAALQSKFGKELLTDNHETR